MAKFTGVIFAGIMGLMNVALVMACSCEVKHPQTQFKEAKFVVKARVTRKLKNQDDPDSPSSGNQFLVYEARVKKIFKGRRLFDSDFFNMYTAQDNPCGIKSMKPGRNYLISGRHENSTFRLTVCSWVEDWSELTKQQKGGLKPTYTSRCTKCDVPSVSGPELLMTMIDPRQPTDLQAPPPKLYSLSGLWTSSEGHCTYNPVDSWQFPTSDCETRFTYCMRDSEEQCAWQLNNKYKECFIDRETAWAKREVRRTTFRGRTGVTRLGNNLNVQCSLAMPEGEFHRCMRREVAKIVTRFLV